MAVPARHAACRDDVLFDLSRRVPDDRRERASGAARPAPNEIAPAWDSCSSRMDPARDTPETLAKVQRERHLDPPSWILLQPAAADVRPLAAILGVRYRALADGEFNHTTTLVLLDAEGRVLARTEQIGAAGDPEFAAAVRAAAAAR